ncbi:discoidin domain-containing protein [Paenibacillus solisilvae]|uniref:Discoidin domain-containing protein n=1 Tax=Paenibacillus solisilvae TaxID=2486751 RepID=A0ABW0W977_9BACL
MFKKSMFFILSAFLLLSSFGFTTNFSSAQAVDAKGQWKSWRNDTGNSGYQPDPGKLDTASEVDKVFIKGAVDKAPVFADVNNDGINEIVMVDAGRVAAVDMDGHDVWMSDVILAKSVYTVDDLNSDGSLDVLVFGDKKMVVLSAASGALLYTAALDEQLNEPRFKLGDFDKDGNKEAAVWNYKKPFIYIYKFSTAADGSFFGELVNKIVDTRSENEGNIAAFYPGIAFGNMDGDNYDELAIIRHAGIDLYDGKMIGTKKESAAILHDPLTFTTVTAESEYPGGGYPATNLIDGNLASYYISEPKSGAGITTGTGWVELSFASPKNVSKVSAYSLQGCGFNVQTWDPLEGWVTRASFSSSDSHYSQDGEFRTDIDFGSYVLTDKIRINVTSSTYGNGTDSYQVQFTEVKAYGEDILSAITPTKVARDQIKSISADSNNPGYTPEMLINDNTSDYWISEQKAEAAPGNKGEAVIQIDLTKKKTLQGVKFYNLIVPYVNVETWNNQKEQWEAQRTVDGESSAAINVLTFAKPVETNKIRISIKKSSFGNGNDLFHVQLSEIELFELTTSITVDSVTAESEYPGGGYPASNLIDGDTSSYFISAPKDEPTGSAWIDFNLPAGTVIGSIVVHALSAPNVEVQVMQNGEWQTRTSMDLTQGPSPATIDLSSQPIVTDKLRLYISGSNFGAPGAHQVQLTEVQLFKPAGKVDEGITPEYKVDWMPPGAESGRNYGYFTLTNIDNDPYDEAIIVADGVSYHIGVVDNNANGLSLIWDRYFGYAGQPSKVDGLLRVMKVVNDPVVDVNNDGKPEIVYGMFESVTESSSGNWTIHVIDASNPDSPGNITLPGYYLWGIEDVNGDSKYELLVTKENEGRPSGQSPIEVLALNSSGAYESILQLADSSFVLASKPAENHISAASGSGLNRPMVYDFNGDGKNDLLVYSGGKYKALSFNGTAYEEAAVYDSSHGAPVAYTKDNNGDAVLLMDNGTGVMTALRKDGSVMWERASGGPLDVVPVVADIDQDGINEMIVPTGSEIVAYKMGQNGASFMWRAAGIGKSTPSASKSLVIADMNGDQKQEIIVAGSSGGKPEIKVIDDSGHVAWSYVFTKDVHGKDLGFTAGAILDWLAADFNGDGVKDIYVALQNTYPTGRSAIIDGVSKQLIYVTEPTVSVTYANHPEYHYERAMVPSPGNAAAYDADGDGAEEIYFIALETYVKLDYDQASKNTRLDYYIAQDVAQNSIIYYATPIITDVDKDAVSAGPEHIISGGFNSFSVFSNELPVAGQPLVHPNKLWHIVMPVTEYNDDDTPKNFGDSDIMRRNQGVADVDGDGIKEIALQYSTDDDRGDDKYRGILYCYDATNGNVKWTYDLKAEFGGKNVITRDIVSADIDSDGLSEFILTTNTGWVMAVNGGSDSELAANNQSRIQWKVNLGASLGNPVIADADNDGFADVLVPAEDGYIHVIGKQVVRSIDSVSANLTSQQPNTMQLVVVTVDTKGMANNTPVSVELVTNEGVSLAPAVSAAGVINSNHAAIPFIVPSSITAGNYFFKVSAQSITNSSTGYSISASAPVTTKAVSFFNGVATTYSLADLIANGTIATDGILFIPSSFSYQLKNAKVDYSAAQGIYIGADIRTKASNADIILRSSKGPVVVDNAAFTATTGSNNITMLAGTYISAKGTHFTTKNSGDTSLTANETIDLSNAEINTGDIHLSARDGASSILTTNANFHGDTPSITATTIQP